MANRMPTPPEPPAPPPPPALPMVIEGAGGEMTEISTKDGKTVITRTDADGTTKTVTVTGMPDFGGMALGEREHSHNFGVSSWVLVIALFVIAGLVRTWIRARHGDPRAFGRRRRGAHAGGAGTERDAELLAEENARLRGNVTKLEERIAVLERIVTDPAKRVSDEIDALR